MTPQRKFLTILILGLLTAVVPFSIDMYLPGFPAIAKSMDTTVSRVALSLSSFFVGIALGQLLYGPILDRFGRKIPLYAGLLFYCLTSIACSFARSIELLILLRFIQAIGACSASVAAVAMVRDFFPPKENARIFSFLMLVLSASPMLAPTIGGYITTTFGWQAIFLVLGAIVFIILVAVYFFLPGSKPADKTYSLNIGSILNNYRSILKNRQFLVYSFTGGIAFAGMFTYISSSPGIFMGFYKLSQQQYGILFAVMASGFIIASQVNNKLLKKYSSESIMRGSLIVQNLFGLLILLAAVFSLPSFWVLVVLLFFFIGPIGLMLPNSSALSMRPFDQNTGTAAALLGFIQMVMGSVGSVVIGLLDVKTVLPMSIGLLCTSVIALIVLVIGQRGIEPMETRPDAEMNFGGMH